MWNKYIGMVTKSIVSRPTELMLGEPTPRFEGKMKPSLSVPFKARRARLAVFFGSLLAAACALGVSAYAEDYPKRAIHMIVGFSAGGPTDVLCRILADQLNKSLGVPIIVENRVGAGGNLAASAVARAPTDGYTLLFGGNNYVIGRSWYKNLQFDIMRDLQIVSTVSKNPNVLVVNPASDLKTLEDVLQKARANPGHLTFASAGSGTVIHLAGEIFKSQAKLDLQHVPYSGAAPAEVDLMGARVNMMFDSLTTALPFIKDGSFRAIGVTSKDRSSYAPEIPTLAELGLESFDVTSWYALWAPVGIPKEIVDKLNRATRAALATSDMRARLATLQAEAFVSMTEESEAFQRLELTKWTNAVQALGPRSD